MKKLMWHTYAVQEMIRHKQVRESGSPRRYRDELGTSQPSAAHLLLTARIGFLCLSGHSAYADVLRRPLDVCHQSSSNKLFELQLPA